MSLTSRIAAAAVAVLLLGAALGATAMAHADSGANSRVLAVTATDYAFHLSSRRTLAAGRVELDLTNAGAVDHMAMIVRLHDGVTPEQLVAVAAKQGEGAALALVDFVGGSAPIHPGGRQVTYQVLRAGKYVIVCLLPTPAGGTHLTLGMHVPFTVAGGDSSTGAPAPVAGTITAHDMTFTLPAGFDGHGVYRFGDTDATDAHELTLLRLAPGKHAADVAAWFRRPGPPPFSFAGGFGATEPGTGGWVRLDLAPGTYAATCFVPDDAPPHAPHGAMGMIVEFAIGRRSSHPAPTASAADVMNVH